jgi:hypothetical protein
MCCLGYEYSDAREDIAPPDAETISVAEDLEESEVVVVSSDSLADSVEPVMRPPTSRSGMTQEPQQTAQQPGMQDRREKRRKWHPRKRRRKPHKT